MKVFNFILAVIFLGFASVQVNDPDPILWILIYGVMASISVMAMFRFYIKWLIATMAVGLLIYGILLWPGMWEWINSDDPALLFDNIAKMENIYIELAREFLGVLMSLTVLAMHGYQSLKF